jgi:hypothetical protein
MASQKFVTIECHAERSEASQETLSSIFCFTNKLPEIAMSSTTCGDGHFPFCLRCWIISRVKNGKNGYKWIQESQSGNPAPSDFAPRNDSRQRVSRSMVPVRLAGAEVTEAFCTSAAGDYCGCARRGTGLVGSRFPERITQITNAAEVLPFVVDRHPEPRMMRW